MYYVKCGCTQKEHRAPLEVAEISEGGIEKIPEILSDYKKIYVVSDENTYKAAGKRIEELLRDSGQLSHTYTLKCPVLPDTQSIGSILIHAQPDCESVNIMSYSPLPDYILAVGSGTVNDCCRVVSYRLGIPYGIAATAPSMDGYASAGSPLLFDGSKATVRCTTPRHIIADLNIVSEAPYEMLLAGIGDMLGKYTAILDWELARDYTGEYFCPDIARQVIDAANRCAENAGLLKSRSHTVIKSIMEGFIISGLGMAYTGCSRPASGSEHMVGHVWEIMDVKDGKLPALHGLEVAEGTRIIAAFYKKLYEETDDRRFKALTAPYLPYFSEIEKLCKSINMPCPVTDREKIRQGVIKGHRLRNRYTILEYLSANHLLEEYSEFAADFITEEKN